MSTNGNEAGVNHKHYIPKVDDDSDTGQQVFLLEIIKENYLPPDGNDHPYGALQFTQAGELITAPIIGRDTRVFAGHVRYTPQETMYIDTQHPNIQYFFAQIEKLVKEQGYTPESTSSSLDKELELMQFIKQYVDQVLPYDESNWDRIVDAVDDYIGGDQEATIPSDADPELFTQMLTQLSSYLLQADSYQLKADSEIDVKFENKKIGGVCTHTNFLLLTTLEHLKDKGYFKGSFQSRHRTPLTGGKRADVGHEYAVYIPNGVSTRNFKNIYVLDVQLTTIRNLIEASMISFFDYMYEKDQSYVIPEPPTIRTETNCVIEGVQYSHVHFINGEVNVGRELDCQLIIPNEKDFVGRHHCQLVGIDNTLFLKEIEASKHGTRLMMEIENYEFSLDIQPKAKMGAVMLKPGFTVILASKSALDQQVRFKVIEKDGVVGMAQI